MEGGSHARYYHLRRPRRPRPLDKGSLPRRHDRGGALRDLRLRRRGSRGVGAVRGPKGRACTSPGSRASTCRRGSPALGVDCEVGAVSKMIKPSADRRRKNDRNDAEFLARMLSVGNVVEVWVPDDECEAARDLTRSARGREGRPLALEAAALKFLLRHGLVFDEGRPPAAGRATGPGRTGPGSSRLGSRRGRQRRARLLRRRGQAGGGGERRGSRGSSRPRPASPWRRRRGRLPALPQGRRHRDGRRPRVRGRRVLGFRNARSFAAWVGLTPSEHSSGESDRRGAITKAGNKHLRKALVEAAWHYLTCSARPKDLAKGRPRTGSPEACRQGRAEACRGGRRCSRAGSTATRRTWPRRASSPAGCGRSASWPRRRRGGVPRT